MQSSNLTIEDINNYSRADLVKLVKKISSESNKKINICEGKLDVLRRRVERKNIKIKSLETEVYFLNRKNYNYKLRSSKVRTKAKNESYEKAVNNIVNKSKSLIDISKYHMSVVELSEVFKENPSTIVVLMWASRYEVYSKKEFDINFPDSPIRFLKHNMTLLKKGYCNKWEQKRSSYYLSPRGKDITERINKYIEKRVK
jgi:hypothetical protein